MNGGTGDYWWEEQADISHLYPPYFGRSVPLCWRCNEPKAEPNPECKGHPHD